MSSRSTSKPLATATRTAAEALGRSDLGRIEPGAIADLLIVDGDPTTDIHALRNVVSVYLAGTLVDRSALELPRNESLVREKPTRDEGASCAAADECASSLTCSSRHVCRKSCTVPSACDRGSSCLPETPSTGTCAPSDAYDLVAQDCANAAACIFTGNGPTHCWFAGTAAHGQSCASTGVCARGSRCDPTKGRCRRICEISSTACACEDMSSIAGLPIGLYAL